MPFYFETTEEVETIEDMALLLENFATQIRKGFTGGYAPHWDVKEIKKCHKDECEEDACHGYAKCRRHMQEE